MTQSVKDEAKFLDTRLDDETATVGRTYTARLMIQSCIGIL